ncbi:hemin-degrading factor [Hoeflea sp.]|uniref:hemin-degrading factor n=1 Tax=Hoeflea sp. TaxID=1940281 RepID=UPI003B5215B7
MTQALDHAAIVAAQNDNPKMRARDLAAKLGITEGELVAASCGETATRIDIDFARIFPSLEKVGEVMALTRNESAVHEKIGVYDKFIGGKHAAMMLGEKIDMRMFAARWAHGFAVETSDGDTIKRSLQFFDAHGDAVHKVHAREATDVALWDGLVADLAVEDQSAGIAVTAAPAPAVRNQVDTAELRDRWSRMTDTHQFVGLLKKLDVDRLAAIRAVGEDFTWQIDNSAVEAMLRLSAKEALPIMCFVGNHACIQIHSGPVGEIRMMGPWLNIMDADFHLHLRTDHIKEVWAVRKPTDNNGVAGHVTSLEAYGADGDLIIQFFGKRIEGQDERPLWRDIMESLPRVDGRRAA